MSCSFAHPNTEHSRTKFGEAWNPEPCYVRVKPATLFHPSFPEVHEMLLNGEMVDCKVPENVMKAFVQGRVVICPTKESAQIMKDLVFNTTGRIPEDASVEVEPRT